MIMVSHKLYVSWNIKNTFLTRLDQSKWFTVHQTEIARTGYAVDTRGKRSISYLLPISPSIVGHLDCEQNVWLSMTTELSQTVVEVLTRTVLPPRAAKD